MSEVITCPLKCLEQCQECPSDDFLYRNGPWLLTVLASVSVCFGYLLTYLLKSRCKLIKMCCITCERIPLDIDANSISFPAPTPSQSINN